jgi:hypothetical protein
MRHRIIRLTRNATRCRHDGQGLAEYSLILLLSSIASVIVLGAIGVSLVGALSLVASLV